MDQGADFVGEEIWSPLAPSSSKPCPCVSSSGWRMTSCCRNFTTGCTVHIELLWVTIHGSGLEEGSPQALLGSRGQLLPCGSKQRVRDVVMPRSWGSTALATLWSGSIGLLEMSQLWLCSVPLGNGCLKALPGWETWNFLDNSGFQTSLCLHSNYWGFLWEFWGTTWTA